MKNREKFRKKLDIFLTTSSPFGVNKDGRPVPCGLIDCHDCSLCSSCVTCPDKRKKWLDEEYIEVDWSKVPIDTKVLVRDFNDLDWQRGYFAGVDEKGTPLTWLEGRTSFTAMNKYPGEKVIDWKYIMLYDEDEEEQCDED